MRWKVGLLGLAALLALAWSPQAQTSRRAAVFMADLMPQLNWEPPPFLALPIVREDVSLPSGGQQIPADLYRPTGAGPFPGVVLVHGVTEPGRRDLRLVVLSEALARQGVVVFVPQLENLAHSRISISDVPTLVDSVLYLSQQVLVRPERVGLGGFSIGASLALIAAADPAIADRLRLVIAFGPYADLRSFITSVTTQSYLEDNRTVPWQPTEGVYSALGTNLIALTLDPEDQANLMELLFDQGQGSVEALSPEGKATYDLLTNSDWARLDALFPRLGPRTQEVTVQLSPLSSVHQVRAPVVLMHSRRDPTIPYVESVRLGRALTPQQVWLGILDIFTHVNPDLPPLSPASLVEVYIPELSRFFAGVYRTLWLLD